MEKDLHKLTREELGRLFPIILTPYNDAWPDRFEKEKDRIISLLGEHTALRVEHIGSTAVPGLEAKPTIDMLVEIPKGEQTEDRIIRIMTSNGYDYMKNQKDHIMVVKGYSPEGFKGQCYHIHMGPADHKALWNRVLFRRYLKKHPDSADEYAALKKKLAETYRFDREAYTEAKTEFIEKITDIAIAKTELDV